MLGGQDHASFDRGLKLYERMAIQKCPDVAEMKYGGRTARTHPFVISPNSHLRNAWDLASLLIICVETFAVPLTLGFPGAPPLGAVRHTISDGQRRGDNLDVEGGKVQKLS